MLILTKKWVGLNFGRFFHKLVCGKFDHMYECVVSVQGDEFMKNLLGKCSQTGFLSKLIHYLSL
jgi:hypothetical protein